MIRIYKTVDTVARILSISRASVRSPWTSVVLTGSTSSAQPYSAHSPGPAQVCVGQNGPLHLAELMSSAPRDVHTTLAVGGSEPDLIASPQACILWGKMDNKLTDSKLYPSSCMLIISTVGNEQKSRAG